MTTRFSPSNIIPPHVIDETIAHYRIVRQLGAGGMGVVYEALDIKLERRVALKFLPETTHRNPQSLERFLREARSASALNHSGICTIHAIEEHDGRTFIAMELLEGHTLEQVLKTGVLPIPRTIDIGIQLADALDTAHKKNIVHRDIKPANVFATDRGPVKILDFGLAKLMQGDVTPLDGQTLSGQTALLTSPGTAVGTIAYMSPEQARGEELDARSDLFSLGAVLYEMVTGKLAFPGTTSAVVFDNILHNAPVSPVTLNPDTPPELERILNKALEKDRDFRYQGAAELRADLKRLQRELDPARPGSGSTRTTTATAAATSGSKTAAETKPSSGSVLVEAAGRNKFGTGIVLGITFVVLLAAGFGVYSLLKPAPPPPKRLPFERVEITNLTNNGHVAVARISPDGKYLLHALEENGLQSLWLRHIPTGSNTQVVAPAATRYFGLTFSPDGNYIYFVRRDEAEHTISILYNAPVLGGTPRIIVRDVDSPITFSPDGQRFAFLHERHDSPFWDLWSFKSDGSDKQAIFSNKPISSDSKTPIWSPDGKTILIPVTQLSLNDHGGFVAVDIATAKDHFVAGTPTRIYYDAAWLPDGKALITPSASMDSGFLKIQLGYLTYPEGEFRALTVDANDYLHPSVSADGTMIVANQNQYRQQIQVATANEAGASDWKTLPLSSQLLVWRWSWLPDGRLVLPQSGDVRIVNPAGGESVILSDRVHVPDQVTVCGKSYIAFRQIGRSGGASANLWRMNFDGTEQKQLTSGLNDTDPTCSADGKWVYYLDANDSHYLKRVSIDGGRPETALQEPVGPYAISPDGSKALTLDVRDFDHKLVLRADDVASHKTEYLNVDPRASYPFAYAPGGQAIVYNVREHGIDNLWRQALDGSGRKQLTHFTSERIGQFAFSPDGKSLAVDRGHLESDAVLLKESPATQK